MSVVDGANRRGPDSMSQCLTAEGNFSLFLYFHYIISNYTVPEVPDITPRPTNYPDNPDDPVEVFIDIEVYKDDIVYIIIMNHI